MAASNAASSSSSAGISVSGTYRPPNAPKRCAVSVATLVRVESGGCGKKLAHQPRVFDSGRALHARGDVDDVGSEGSYGAHDVVRLQSACQHDRGAPPVARKIDGEITPRKRL